MQKVRLHFGQTYLNDDRFNPSSATGTCFIHPWERMRRTAFARETETDLKVYLIALGREPCLKIRTALKD